MFYERFATHVSNCVCICHSLVEPQPSRQLKLMQRQRTQSRFGAHPFERDRNSLSLEAKTRSLLFENTNLYCPSKTVEKKATLLLLSSK